MLNLVDSHCHLNFEPLGNDQENVLARAKENGVGHMLCVSVTLEKFPEIRSLAQRRQNISASVGVHPNEQSVHDPDIEELVTLAKDPSVVAIGETGLDYYRSTGGMRWQQERFRRHIRAAKVSGLPLIIHMRDAAEDLIHILREEKADEVGGVMHCFTGTTQVAEQAMNMNFYISFSGIITFKNAEDLRLAARHIPDDRLLIETDSPYLAPVPYRGRPNEPAYVRYVAEHLAELRQVNLDQLAEQTRQNFFTLFTRAKPAAIA